MDRGWKKKVLDHGYVQLVDFMGSDESIVEAARMSTGKGFEGWDPHERCERCGISQTERNEEGVCEPDRGHAWGKKPGDAKLLEHLYANAHMTPFEMCELVVESQAPIMVYREWHRHRTQSYNEMSARYIQMPNLHYVPEVSRIQKQSKSNKQGSAEAFPEERAKEIGAHIAVEQLMLYNHYDNLVEEGVAKEVARINTPVSRYSRMRAKANLRNWLGFLLLRKKPAAQWEIRQYADAVGEIIEALFPRTYALFMEHTFNAVTLSASEVAELTPRVTCGYSSEVRSKAFGSACKKLGL